MAQSVIAAADVPPVRLSTGPEYRLKDLTERAGSAAHSTPMLYHLFAPAHGFSSSDHHHAATFAIGGIELTGEAMRENMLTASGGSGQKARVVERVWAAGFHADWAAGANDSLSLGVAADKDKRAEVAILPGTTHIKGSALATELSWVHDGHLRMSAGWHVDSSASHAVGAERLVELAQGAALREQGFRMTVSYLLGGSGPSQSTVFGIAAGDARVAAQDLAMIGSSYRRDARAALFFRGLF